ncbi:hypothetical protein OAK87_00580 [bacterium]|nr:hypothetical protein [bacterium]
MTAPELFDTMFESQMNKYGNWYSATKVIKEEDLCLCPNCRFDRLEDDIQSLKIDVSAIKRLLTEQQQQ